MCTERNNTEQLLSMITSPRDSVCSIDKINRSGDKDISHSPGNSQSKISAVKSRKMVVLFVYEHTVVNVTWDIIIIIFFLSRVALVFADILAETFTDRQTPVFRASKNSWQTRILDDRCRSTQRIEKPFDPCLEMSRTKSGEFQSEITDLLSRRTRLSGQQRRLVSTWSKSSASVTADSAPVNERGEQLLRLICIHSVLSTCHF